MECLLSYIEIVQFQRYVSQFIKDDAILKKYNLVKFPSVVPQSEIIEQEEEILNDYGGDERLLFAKMKAHKIYEKYIRIGSEFEINISSKERRKINKVVSNLELFLRSEKWEFVDLMDIYEVSKNEMWSLLNYSLKRLRSDDNQIELSALTDVRDVTVNLSLFPTTNSIVPGTPSPDTPDLTPEPTPPPPSMDLDNL